MTNTVAEILDAEESGMVVDDANDLLKSILSEEPESKDEAKDWIVVDPKEEANSTKGDMGVDHYVHVLEEKDKAANSLIKLLQKHIDHLASTIDSMEELYLLGKFYKDQLALKEARKRGPYKKTKGKAENKRAVKTMRPKTKLSLAPNSLSYATNKETGAVGVSNSESSTA